MLGFVMDEVEVVWVVIEDEEEEVEEDAVEVALEAVDV